MIYGVIVFLIGLVLVYIFTKMQNKIDKKYKIKEEERKKYERETFDFYDEI